jgi:ribosomal-protein-alanine N-acetyltransferase
MPPSSPPPEPTPASASPLALGRADFARDLDGILAVDEATFERPPTREAYLWEAANSDVSRVWVARDGAGVVGYCAGWVIFDELHVNNLAVYPARRRRGVAAALLAYVLEDAAREGASRATLEVRRSNEPARRLYERFGFAYAGVRPRYYREPIEDALVLWRHGPAGTGQTASTGPLDPEPAG